MRWALLAGLLVAAVALSVGTFAATSLLAGHPTPLASVGTHRVGHKGRTAPVGGQDRAQAGYLALGDSVAFGYRPTSVTPLAGYLHPASFTGYPEDLAKTLGLHLVNASCPGETTASMIDPAAPSNGCENSVQGGPGYRGFAPLHVGFSGSQLSFAVHYLERHPGTTLVTIDIGANDIFLCQQTTADQCAGADFARVRATISRNLATILSAVRNQAHYRHALVVLTYYALSYDDNASVTQTRDLNAALTGPAARYGARIADGYVAFRVASVRSGGDTCAAGLRIKQPAGGCDLHPTAVGQRVLAMAVQRALGHRGT
jgi:lysophospholipase L1-like esterase